MGRSGADVVDPESGPSLPSTEAVEAAAAAQRRAKRNAPVRYSFIRRYQAGEVDPPLARILRGGHGGRGGDVRLRLYLSLLWMARDDPTFSFPARAWAALLGLDTPTTNGARRVKQALRWLDEAGFLHLERAPGRDSVVHLLDDSGSGQAYELPGTTHTRLKNAGKAAESRKHLYVQLPAALWTQGWMSLLHGPAVAMLLVFYLESRPGHDGAKEWVWISPTSAQQRYALSEDTRTKGVRQLKAAGLVEVRRRAVAPDSFDYTRVRNVYRLVTDRIHGPARIDPEQGLPKPEEDFMSS